MDRVFDRRASFDPRSLDYGIRTLLAAKPARSYSWRHVQLDQGSEGACVGFSVAMEAAARPKPVFGDPCKKSFTTADVLRLNKLASAVYHRAQEIDEWPGEDYEGTSVLAGMKAGREMGWWEQYRWALGPTAEAAADDVMRTVGRFGPVVMGTWWWSGMMAADADGFLHPTGRPLGGHAFLLTRYNAKRDAVWTPNSWGGWGQGWIKRADVVKLLAEDGEGSVPVGRKPAA